jgi:hypothetical protein
MFTPPQLKAKQNHKLSNLKHIIKTKAILTSFLFVNYNSQLMRVFFKHCFYPCVFLKLSIDDLKF